MAPPNLEFMAADAVDLAEHMGDRRFDVVLSYWMLPHIILDDVELALDAVKNMFAIAKPDGLVAIGPQSATNNKHAVITEMAHYEAGIDFLARQIVHASTLSPPEAAQQRQTNFINGVFDYISPFS